MSKKFFEVVAKCGHVGRNRYYEAHFFVEAANASEAAKTARYFPRVKHDHADAILSVSAVSEQQYLDGRTRWEQEVYFCCRSRYEQDAHWDEIAPHVLDEPEQVAPQKKKGENKIQVYIGKNKLRKPAKYLRRYDDGFDFKRGEAI